MFFDNDNDNDNDNNKRLLLGPTRLVTAIVNFESNEQWDEAEELFHAASINVQFKFFWGLCAEKFVSNEQFTYAKIAFELAAEVSEQDAKTFGLNAGISEQNEIIFDDNFKKASEYFKLAGDMPRAMECRNKAGQRTLDRLAKSHFSPTPTTCARPV